MNKKLFIMLFSSILFFSYTSSAPQGQKLNPFSVGNEETIISHEVRHKLGLTYWPDGNIGLKRLSENTYMFLCANGSKIAKTEGTLNNPVSSGVKGRDIAIRGIPGGYGYAAGGPIYSVSSAEVPPMTLMVYHSEQYPTSDEKDYYAALNLAVSRDDGDSWEHLGQIVTPTTSYKAWRAKAHRTSFDVGGGTFTIVKVDGIPYFYVYFADDPEGPEEGPVSVARARVDLVIQAAKKGRAAPWVKYYQHNWNEPGIGGRSTNIFTNKDYQKHRPYWFAVSYNTYVKRYIMVSTTSANSWAEPVSTQLRLSESLDGISWSKSYLIAAGAPDELMYPTIVGMGKDPLEPDRQFAIYYIRSKLRGWENYQDSDLMRRIISLSRE